MKIPLTDSGGCGIKVRRGCENYSTFAPEKCQNVFQHILIGGTNMSTTLLNKDTVNVLLYEWHMRETENIRIYYQPYDPEQPEPY